MPKTKTKKTTNPKDARMPALTYPEISTILAALRVFQYLADACDGRLPPMTTNRPRTLEAYAHLHVGGKLANMEHFDDVKPLTVAEIDDLCERVNTAPQQTDANVILKGLKEASRALTELDSLAEHHDAAAVDDAMKAAQLHDDPEVDVDGATAFVRQVARLTKDGECVTCGKDGDEDNAECAEHEPWVMPNDDAVDTVHSLISEARALAEGDEAPGQCVRCDAQCDEAGQCLNCTLLAAIGSLGTQDLYTDADEYSNRVGAMQTLCQLAANTAAGEPVSIADVARAEAEAAPDAETEESLSTWRSSPS